MVSEISLRSRLKEKYEASNLTLKKMGVATVAGLGIGVTAACGSSEAAPVSPEKVVAADMDIDGSKSSEIVFGDECNNLEDIYSVGKTRGSGGLGKFESKEDFLKGVILYDGNRNSTNSSVKVELSEDVGDQAWASYELAVKDVPTNAPFNLKKLNIITYGELDPNKSDVDGKLDVQSVCVSVRDIQGNPAV